MDSYFRAKDILDKAICTDSYFQIKSILFGLKAVDVVEVRHARWIKHEGYDECEACHAKTIYGSNYCPSCGAVMEKE